MYDACYKVINKLKIPVNKKCKQIGMLMARVRGIP